MTTRLADARTLDRRNKLELALRVTFIVLGVAAFVLLTLNGSPAFADEICLGDTPDDCLKVDKPSQDVVDGVGSLFGGVLSLLLLVARWAGAIGSAVLLIMTIIFLVRREPKRAQASALGLVGCVVVLILTNLDAFGRFISLITSTVGGLLPS